MQTADSIGETLPDFRPLRRSILISMLLPLGLLQILLHYGLSPARAIAICTIFPLAEIALEWRRTRRLDTIAVLSIGLLAVGLATSWISGDARIALAKESALTAAAGLVFLGSLLTPRPLIFFVSRSYMRGATEQAWEQRWQTMPRFRTTMRTLTALWGAGLLADAIARVVLVYTLAPAPASALSTFVAVGTFGGLVVLTLGYVKMRRRRA